MVLTVGLVGAWLPCSAIARERAAVVGSAVRLESGLTVAPFAVPVATPVAVVQPGGVYYAFSPSSAGDDANLRAEFEAFQRWKQSQASVSEIQSTPPQPRGRATVAEAARPTLVATHCLRCHGGAQAKGGVRLDGTPANGQRLAAIRAVLAGEMPKGKPLAEDVLGELLYELSSPSFFNAGE
jgi:mono/diheme cytochrome c family protein